MDGIDTKIRSGEAFNLNENFARLSSTWRQETEFCSFLSDIVLNDSYQKIIGLGAPAVPLILRELQKKPAHWHWALHAITQQNAAENAPDGDIKAISNAWIKWGVERGIIS